MTIETAPITARAAEILDIAERMVQTRGFNAFSYADVAEELGISTAALHYHFRSKAALGDALVARYAQRFFEALENISETSPAAPARLTRYVDLYRGVLAMDRMCLCGILAAEYQTLPPGMRDAVVSFFARNETWLEGVLQDGIDRHELTVAEPLAPVAELIIDSLEGAMMVSRARRDPKRFERASSRLLADVLG